MFTMVKQDHLTRSWKKCTILYHHIDYSSKWERYPVFPYTGHYADMLPPHL